MEWVKQRTWNWIMRWQPSKREILQVSSDQIPRIQKHSYEEMTPTNGSEDVRWTRSGHRVTLEIKKLKTSIAKTSNLPKTCSFLGTMTELAYSTLKR